ncbi:MFS transporter [Flavobacterium agricola]|uniref:MFS transporter n=1 Tax=Flavobacterium agricola TaxID=2870839 RepID=A0ABY6LXZ2_9FLAO|nr:MFS transporter [Flavobacterium agricola]UYW01204.1 MFS transporter [Flavobacterium agricola]
MTPPKLWTANFILSCSSSFLIAFAFYLVGSVMPFFVSTEFGTNDEETGLILASYIIAALVLRPFSGYLVDTFPRKKILIYSLILFTVLFYGYMVASTLFILVLIRVLQGFTWSTTTTANSTLTIDIIPSEKRGEGIGYYGLTSTLSMAIGPMLGLLMYEYYPVEVNFYAATFFGFLSLVLAWFIKVPHREPDPEKAPISLDRFILLKAIPVGINLLGIAMCYGSFYAFAALYGKQLQVENTGWFFLFMAVGMTLSRLFAGKLLDRGHMHKLMAFSLILLAISLFAFGFATSKNIFFISAFFIGLSYGVLSPIFQNLFINLAKPEKRGTANSTFFTFYDLGIGIGMVVSGKVAHAFGYHAIFISGAVLILTTLAFYWFISKPLYNKHKII